ncbi:MAG: hypothetical protein WA624_17150 [Methylocella sp.]
MAALAHRQLLTPPTTPPVFTVAIMVATCRLELGLSGARDMSSAAGKPATKIWGAAFASQGPLDAADGAIHCIRRAEGAIRFRLNPIAFSVFAYSWPRI